MIEIETGIETESMLLVTEDEVTRPGECDFSIGGDLDPQTFQACEERAWFYDISTSRWYCARHAALMTGDTYYEEEPW